MSSSRRSSQPRDQIQVSCMAGRLFNHLSHQGSCQDLDAWAAHGGMRWGRERSWKGQYEKMHKSICWGHNEFMRLDGQLRESLLRGLVCKECWASE